MASVKQYRDCLLNTCVRFAREYYPEINLSTCMENKDFVVNARQWLESPYFTNPIENNMEIARNKLINELYK